MKRLGLMLVALCGCLAQSQLPVTPPIEVPDGHLKLPNGKTQREMIVKDDYKRNLEDAAELAKLAEELKTDLDNGDKYVVSIKALKKTEEIEKLAHNIHGRLKRY